MDFHASRQRRSGRLDYWNICTAHTAPKTRRLRLSYVMGLGKIRYNRSREGLRRCYVGEFPHHTSASLLVQLRPVLGNDFQLVRTRTSSYKERKASVEEGGWKHFLVINAKVDNMSEKTVNMLLLFVGLTAILPQ